MPAGLDQVPRVRMCHAPVPVAVAHRSEVADQESIGPVVVDRGSIGPVVALASGRRCQRQVAAVPVFSHPARWARFRDLAEAAWIDQAWVAVVAHRLAMSTGLAPEAAELNGR